jgi:hypothetical protein
MSEPKRYLWKVLRWFVLGALLLIIILMLRKPAPIARPMDQAAVAQKAAEFQAKIQHLAEAHQSGERAEARLEADEVNAALQQAVSQTTTQQSGEAPPIQTTQVFFRDDTVVAQFLTQVYGKDVVVTVSERSPAKMDM